MHKQPLNTHWTLRPVGDLSLVPERLRQIDISAAVPGCVHTALLAAGLIDDPYLADNEATLQWIGLCDWEYRCTFTADAELFEHQRIDLACDGLDTVATIRLNDVEVAKTENMHVGYRFALAASRVGGILPPHQLGGEKPPPRAELKRGQNVLSITFASPVSYARAMEARLGPRPYINCAEPFNFIRKMACNFGWDWGPVLTTSGVWKEVRIEGWSGARIARVHSAVDPITDESATLNVQVSLEYSGPDSANDLQLISNCWRGDDRSNLQEISLTNRPPTVRYVLNISGPKRWSPAGSGAPDLYRLGATVSRSTSPKDQMWVHNMTTKIGLRSVELDTSPDQIGRQFVLRVNGKPVFCKGFNWIPDDCFLDRACTRERYRTRLQQAADTGANMLRVWGGGIYETDDFYDLCDEMGLMVWQDFPFACATYPEEEPFWSLVEAEARYNVARLAHHPSLVLWNGCNENLLGYANWGWREQVKGKPWGYGYYFDLLARVVNEVDPGRPYWPASPYSGDPDVDAGLHPNLDTHGNKHVWESWFTDDYTAYRRFRARFCSEFGFQGPPQYATLHRAIGDSATRFDSPLWKAHQKSPSGDANNDRHLERTFNTPADADDRYFLLQLNQARALQLGVEWYRSLWPVCTGVLYWQLNDCWPVVSWAAIDGDGRLKPLYYATKKFFAGRMVTIQPAGEAYAPGDPLTLCLINDTDAPWRCTGLSHRTCFTTGPCPDAPAELIDQTVPPRTVGRIDLDGHIVTPRDATREMIVAQIDGCCRGFWYFGKDKTLQYPAPKLRHTLDRTRVEINPLHRPPTTPPTSPPTSPPSSPRAQPARPHAAIGRDGDAGSPSDSGDARDVSELSDCGDVGTSGDAATDRPVVYHYALTLTADTFVRDLVLNIDRLDPAAVANDQLITLLPGETFTFTWRSTLDLNADALTTRPVLTAASWFGAAE